VRIEAEGYEPAMSPPMGAHPSAQEQDFRLRRKEANRGIRGSLFFRDEDRALEGMFARLADLNITPELETESKSSSKAEVVERVIRRAQELQAAWHSNANEENRGQSAE
jgi:hypothetical protein